MRVHVAPAEGLALVGAAAVLLIQSTGLAPALEYRRAVLTTEPWRLLTGHLVHVNWRHACVNALAWIALARLYAPEFPPSRQAALLAASALGTSLLLWLAAPAVAWYRGLSGALHGLFAAGAVLWLARCRSGGAAVRWRPCALAAGLLALVWVKVLAEQWLGGPIANENWLGASVITAAHLYGAAAGTLIGILTAAVLRPATIHS